MRITVEKYQGLGNDYLVYDPNLNQMELTPRRVQLLCNRNFGVGADGIMEGPRTEVLQKTAETGCGFLPGI